jgi:hypothetical protein
MIGAVPALSGACREIISPPLLHGTFIPIQSPKFNPCLDFQARTMSNTYRPFILCQCLNTFTDSLDIRFEFPSAPAYETHGRNKRKRGRLEHGTSFCATRRSLAVCDFTRRLRPRRRRKICLGNPVRRNRSVGAPIVFGPEWATVIFQGAVGRPETHHLALVQPGKYAI